MQVLRYPAPAKLNLMLHIIGRRADGYHQLQTVFQFIDYSDAMQFTLRQDNKICRVGNAYKVQQSEDIVIKAAEKLRKIYRAKKKSIKKEQGVDISYRHNIPMGAGLGGGSSKAATTLLALNKLWQMALSQKELEKIGLTLGADVPIFIAGFAAFAEGIGEQLSKIELAENWFLLLIPPVQISTKKVFSHQQLTRDTSSIKLCDLSGCEWKNDCTEVVKENYPKVAQAFDIIDKYTKAKMSGTGATVFASFQTKVQAGETLRQIREKAQIKTWKCIIAKGLNKSPLHQIMENECDLGR